jgi:hypothetical protein
MKSVKLHFNSMKEKKCKTKKCKKIENRTKTPYYKKRKPQNALRL